MKQTRTLPFAQAGISAITFFGANVAFAATNWGAATGPSVGAISGNVATSLVGVASGFEAFLYLMGIVFLVLFLLALWKYKKSEGRDGNVGLIVTYLFLSAGAMAAPTVMGSSIGTIFGTASVTKVAAPAPSFTGN